MVTKGRKTARRRIASSFIRTLTVGFGITPNHASLLADFTANRELHPAPKITDKYIIIIIQNMSIG